MNQEMAQAVYDQAMKLWVHPETLERNKRGEVTLPVVLRAVQVILGMDGSYEPKYLKVHASTIKKNLNILDRLHAETKTILDGIDLHSMQQRQICITESSE